MSCIRLPDQLSLRNRNIVLGLKPEQVVFNNDYYEWFDGTGKEPVHAPYLTTELLEDLKAYIERNGGIRQFKPLGLMDVQVRLDELKDAKFNLDDLTRKVGKAKEQVKDITKTLLRSSPSSTDPRVLPWETLCLSTGYPVRVVACSGEIETIREEGRMLARYIGEHSFEVLGEMETFTWV